MSARLYFNGPALEKKEGFFEKCVARSYKNRQLVEVSSPGLVKAGRQPLATTKWPAQTYPFG